ncbi:sigma-70 family RNA polymerase sigma factor [Streptomyces sp. NPDC005728]|uniref:sigma-70 family RNA polymerase sigma factor n=1 Tax=Streptomyces sp. NPDC005728 TaxID=3157054 RepID=UPI003406A299
MPEDPFVQHRPLLFTIAYEMLGSAADAEDVLQESYLRWIQVDPATIEHPRPYLVRLVTRQGLYHLGAAGARREDHAGPDLPEAVRTAPGVSQDAELAGSVSTAMLLVLDTLGPTERAVFLLHAVFGYTHGEIAAATGRTEAGVQQIAHRARRHLHARRRPFEPDSYATREIIQRFLFAAASGDIQTLMDLLAPEVVQISEGGGKAAAAHHPITGRADVARFALGVAGTGAARAPIEYATYNGMPAARFLIGGGRDLLLAFEIHDGRITGLYAIRNPDRLRSDGTVRRLDRPPPL